MGHYLLSVWHEDEYEVEFESDEMQRIVAQVDAFNQELDRSGAMVYANGLQPASTAKVIKGIDLSVTDGPFAESKEQMGGFWIIDAESHEAAMEWARKGAAACEGPVEVRAMQGPE